MPEFPVPDYLETSSISAGLLELHAAPLLIRI